jgi:hypothetical protein
MAIKIQSYWKTTNATPEEIQKSVKSCKTQNYRVKYLFELYGTLSDEDVFNLYNYYWPAPNPFKPNLQSSTSRSRDYLTKPEVGILIYCGDSISVYNKTIQLYTMVKNPEFIPKTYKKTIPDTIKVKFEVEDECYVDLNLLYNKCAEQIDKIMNKFNLEEKPIPKVVLPKNDNELEIYIHEKILEANANRRTNVGAVIGRYLAELKEEGVLVSFDYERDVDNRLKTIITVSEPTHIPTIKERLNKLYLQEKRRFKNETNGSQRL